MRAIERTIEKEEENESEWDGMGKAYNIERHKLFVAVYSS